MFHHRLSVKLARPLWRSVQVECKKGVLALLDRFAAINEQPREDETGTSA
jgi:hypothetical protein